MARGFVALSTLLLSCAATVATATPAGATVKVNRFAPLTGPTGTLITIRGNGFTGVRQVEINGSPLKIESVTAKAIRVRTYSYTTKGPISVYSRDWAITNSTEVFTPEDVTPVIQSFTPLKGPPGTVITIKGTGFTRLKQAQINSIPLALESVSPTEVRVKTYSYTTSGQIEMSGADWATALSADTFTAVPTGSENITDYGATHDATTATLRATFAIAHSHYQALIDRDSSRATGYAIANVGAEFLVENDTLYRWVGPGWAWSAVGPANQVVTGNARAWTLARSELTGPTIDVVFRGTGVNPTDTSAPFRYALD